jgi:hypothetical protein
MRRTIKMRIRMEFSSKLKRREVEMEVRRYEECGNGVLGAEEAVPKLIVSKAQSKAAGSGSPLCAPEESRVEKWPLNTNTNLETHQKRLSGLDANITNKELEARGQGIRRTIYSTPTASTGVEANETGLGRAAEQLQRLGVTRLEFYREDLRHA